MIVGLVGLLFGVYYDVRPPAADPRAAGYVGRAAPAPEVLS